MSNTILNQLLKINTSNKFANVKKFDDLNYPSLIWFIENNGRPDGPGNYQLKIYDIITKKCVYTCETCGNGILFCGNGILFGQFNIINDGIFYDKTTRIWFNVKTVIKNSEQFYKITKFKINYNREFTIEQLKDEITIRPPQGGLIKLNDGKFILMGCQKDHRSWIFDIDEFSIHEFPNSYQPYFVNKYISNGIDSNIALAVYKERYILLAEDNGSPDSNRTAGLEMFRFMLYDFIDMVCIKILTFTGGATIRWFHDDMLVFNTNEGIDIYNFASSNDIPEGDMCSVCMERINEKYAIIPCGHTRTCYSCLDHPQLTNCPMCRGDKTSIIRIY